MFSVLEQLINELLPFYETCSEEWVQNHATFNTGKKQIRDVNSKPELLDVIQDFHDYMNEKIIILMMHTSSIQRGCDFKTKITARVKEWNSINYKIATYMKKMEGKVNVNKSFNDLLGIRIILPDKFTHKELEQFMCDTFPGLKLTDSTKKVGYKASHIYFMPQNKNMFPWELQVWYIGDEESNLLSHKQYKQGYTVWENEFTKGGV